MSEANLNYSIRYMHRCVEFEKSLCAIQKINIDTNHPPTNAFTQFTKSLSLSNAIDLI